MRLLRRLRGHDRGALLVFVAIALAALMGLIALSFDLGRMAATQTELQSFADNVALAAAAELDGRPNAITRATAAANALITDRQTFGEGGAILDRNDFRLTFLSELDPDDTPSPAGFYADTVLPPPYDATEQRIARLVRVDVVPREVELTFASVVFDSTGEDAPDGNVAASAVAGFTQVACELATMMFCMPQDSSSRSIDLEIGQMLRIRTDGGRGTWVPGNFGFLEVNGAHAPGVGPCGHLTATADITRCLVGAIRPVGQCYGVSGVTTAPGGRVGIMHDAINRRFGMHASGDPERDNPVFAAAPNVISGDRPEDLTEDGICNFERSTNSVGLPRGADLGDSSTSPFGAVGTFITTTAQRQDYMARNWGWTAGNPDPFPTAQTRWEVYNQEIRRLAGGRILPLYDPLTRTNRVETGRPQCTTHVTEDPNRRVMIAAGVDCDLYGVNGRSRNVPVETYYRMFITEPIGTVRSSREKEMFAEVIGRIANAGSTNDGAFRDVVQLYR